MYFCQQTTLFLKMPIREELPKTNSCWIHKITISISDVSQFMVQDQLYYVTVTAVNYVAMETYSFSDPIRIDTTPPTYGKVVDLYTTYRVDATNATNTVQMNTKICSTDAGIEQND